jgi:hypothetical protein
MDKISVVILAVLGAAILAGILMVALFVPVKSELNYAEGITFKTIVQGHYSEIEEKRSEIIRNDEGFSSLLEERSIYVDGAGIDFDNKMLIAVFQGMKPSGGYSTEIMIIEEFKDFIQVGVVEKSPAEGCVSAMAITSPYHIVEIDKTDKEIRFSYSEQVVGC